MRRGPIRTSIREGLISDDVGAFGPYDEEDKSGEDASSNEEVDDGDQGEVEGSDEKVETDEDEDEED